MTSAHRIVASTIQAGPVDQVLLPVVHRRVSEAVDRREPRRPLFHLDDALSPQRSTTLHAAAENAANLSCSHSVIRAMVTQALSLPLYRHITLREITIFKQQHGEHPNGYREAQ